MAEISIDIKNSETKMSERHNLPDGIRFSKEDPELLKLVKDAMIKFKAASDINDDDYEIVIKGKLIWQN
jgi:hypothetical protein